MGKLRLSSPRVPLQLVWPCLAVVGGLDAGLCLGRECQVEGKEESHSATLVSIPDSEQKVQVQDQVSSATSKVKKRSVEREEAELGGLQNVFKL